MNQLQQLSEYDKHTHVQQTSLIAYREIQSSLGKRQLEVYRVLQDATRKGFDMDTFL